MKIADPLRLILVMIEAPVPFGNAAARWFYVLLKGLVERGHRVTAFAACSKPKEMDQARRLRNCLDHLGDYRRRVVPFAEQFRARTWDDMAADIVRLVEGADE